MKSRKATLKRGQKAWCVGSIAPEACPLVEGLVVIDESSGFTLDGIVVPRPLTETAVLECLRWARINYEQPAYIVVDARDHWVNAVVRTWAESFAIEVRVDASRDLSRATFDEGRVTFALRN